MTTTSDPSSPAVTDPVLAVVTDPDPPPGTDRAPTLDTPSRPSGWAALRPVVLRMHFYAGVFVAPFVVVACLTGLAFLFSPQISDALYAEQLFVEDAGGPVRPLDEQVAAALAAHPEGTLSSVIVSGDPDRTTQVVLDDSALTDDRQRTVYVDPYTGQVRGDLVTWFEEPPAQALLDDLHTGRILGESGRVYSELAASWLPVLVLGGLALWIGKKRAARRRATAVLVPPVGMRPGRARVMGWHGVTGLWLAVALLFIGATGMTWSTYAGERFTAALTALHGRSPQLSAEPVPVGATQVPMQSVLDTAAGAGLVGKLTITPPGEPGAPFTVAERADDWPVQRDQVAVDPYSGRITETILWADYPLLAKATTIGILAHMGYLWGVPNQLALLAMGLGLLSVVFWGYRMWWQRRPTGPDGRARFTEAAPRGTLRGLSQPMLFAVVLVALVVSWLAPVLAVSLAAFLVVDVLLGRRAQRRGGRVAAGGGGA
ncbi:MAG: PepSY-associated TM helix domain-containing protein [Pseudonocardia sp.]